MSKDTTKDIIEKICVIGERIGFNSIKEYSFNLTKNYNPCYDVVWFLNINDLIKNINLTKYFKDDNPWKSFFTNVPIAVFEIEGSTTTSKNQIGNLINIYNSPAPYKFMITNNSGAGNENDTYRRGVKIIRSYSKNIGYKNVYLFDSLHLNNIINSLKFNNKSIINDYVINKNKKGSGGETKSIKYRKQIELDFKKSDLVKLSDWEPEIYDWYFNLYSEYRDVVSNNKTDFFLAKKVVYNPNNETKNVKNKKDYYYVPKLDLCFGFYLGNGFVDFIRLLANQLSHEVYNYPLLKYILAVNTTKIIFPLITFEIETSSSKHCNGGILNMSTHSFCGILVGNYESERHLNALRNYLGINNVFFVDGGRI